MTHPSFDGADNYERLEFLGDAVLKLVVSDYLYSHYPDLNEGDLTQIRAVVVSDRHLAKVGEGLALGELLRMSPSERRAGGKGRVSNLACAFEALLGAMYLDQQWEAIRSMVLHLMAEDMEALRHAPLIHNPKAVLQEWTQAEGWGLPEYRVLAEQGPAHDRHFSIAVYVRGELWGEGEGKTKKEAQQAAAAIAIERLETPFEEGLAQP